MNWGPLACQSDMLTTTLWNPVEMWSNVRVPLLLCFGSTLKLIQNCIHAKMEIKQYQCRSTMELIIILLLLFPTQFVSKAAKKYRYILKWKDMIFENKAQNTILFSFHQCIFKLHNFDLSSLQQGSYYSQYYIINFPVQQSELEIVNHDQKITHPWISWYHIPFLTCSAYCSRERTLL